MRWEFWNFLQLNHCHGVNIFYFVKYPEIIYYYYSIWEVSNAGGHNSGYRFQINFFGNFFSFYWLFHWAWYQHIRGISGGSLPAIFGYPMVDWIFIYSSFFVHQSKQLAQGFLLYSLICYADNMTDELWEIVYNWNLMMWFMYLVHCLIFFLSFD